MRLACPRPPSAPRPPGSQHFPPENATTMLVPHTKCVDTPILDGRQEVQERIKVSCTLINELLAKPRQRKRFFTTIEAWRMTPRIAGVHTFSLFSRLDKKQE